MITDHFQKTHLDKLFDMGFQKAGSHDYALSMTYQSRGEPFRASIIHQTDGRYLVMVRRLRTGGVAHVLISAEDFDSFLEEELIHAEPEDFSSGSGGGGGK